MSAMTRTQRRQWRELWRWALALIPVGYAASVARREYTRGINEAGDLAVVYLRALAGPTAATRSSMGTRQVACPLCGKRVEIDDDDSAIGLAALAVAVDDKHKGVMRGVYVAGKCGHGRMLTYEELQVIEAKADAAVNQKEAA